MADAGGIIAPDDGPDGERFEWHDGQTMVRHHLKVVETAARHKVAVNPHEPIKDTGLRRTYPNWVSREGARGMEYQAWGEPGNGPSHVPTMIFTRMLSGPMDYTPGRILSKRPRWPGSGIDTGTAVSALCEVGGYAVIARKDKASEDWYVGGVTDEEARDILVDMSFLPEGTDYVATIWRDGDKADYRTTARHDIAIDSRTVKAVDKLPLRIAPGGGFAIRLTPAR